MSDAAADELLALPREAPRDPRWPEIEARIGLSYPIAFKHIAERFGDRCWNDFVSILSPLSADYNAQVQAILDAERTSRAGFPDYYVFPLHPEPEGLFPWAITDNGDTLFWIRKHLRWPTLIKGARAPEFEVNFSPCELVLYQIAAGTIRSNIFPDMSGP
jgi:hypothetical protein